MFAVLGDRANGSTRAADGATSVRRRGAGSGGGHGVPPSTPLRPCVVGRRWLHGFGKALERSEVLREHPAAGEIATKAMQIHWALAERRRQRQSTIDLRPLTRGRCRPVALLLLVSPMTPKTGGRQLVDKRASDCIVHRAVGTPRVDEPHLGLAGMNVDVEVRGRQIDVQHGYRKAASIQRVPIGGNHGVR